MKRLVGLACMVAYFFLGSEIPAIAKKDVAAAPLVTTSAFTGSAGCRSCHEKFYQLWSTSFHGLALRPYSDAFAKSGSSTFQMEFI